MSNKKLSSKIKIQPQQKLNYFELLCSPLCPSRSPITEPGGSSPGSPLRPGSPLSPTSPAAPTLSAELPLEPFKPIGPKKQGVKYKKEIKMLCLF